MIPDDDEVDEMAGEHPVGVSKVPTPHVLTWRFCPGCQTKFARKIENLVSNKTLCLECQGYVKVPR